DGIRDKLVTGVQTCALPISDRPVLALFIAVQNVRLASMQEQLRNTQSLGRPQARIVQAQLILNAELERYAAWLSHQTWILSLARSEERRVGKECSSRMVGYS